LNQPTAVEFFSGMGSFAEACRESPVRIVAAFDQSALANVVYRHNFGLAPIDSNLDSIQAKEIPEAEIWWMSPPCTPYSVRGKRADIQDTRARSFLRLMQILPEKRPPLIFLENVRGFAESQVRQLFLDVLTDLKYSIVEKQLCATNFGIPMRRPRHFVVAVKGIDLPLFDSQPDLAEKRSIADFLDHFVDEALIMPTAEFKKYEACLNVIDPDLATAECICFTKGYYRCRLASGSLIKLTGDRVRRFSSREMLRLFGFSQEYCFPSAISEEEATRLLGNAVDVRAIRFLLSYANLQNASEGSSQAVRS
jgi:DNA (cytosine-5)-methyltransferase 1/tRNA (cytosine38-C5)-methyltransferase